MKMKTSHSQRIKRLWPIVAGVGLLFAGGAQADFGPVDLIAGNGLADIGEVSGTIDDMNLNVTFTVDADDWCLTDFHVAAACTIDGIPHNKNNGNPKIGSFSAHYTPTECVTADTIPVEIPVVMPTGCVGDSYVIAAHAVARLINLADLLLDQEANPASCADGTIIASHPGGDSYLNIDVWDNVHTFRGTYDGWCIDLNHDIIPGRTYSCDFYASDAPLPPEAVQVPENMHLVNWLLNQNFVGTEYAGTDEECSGVNTFGDMQQVIWALLDHEVAQYDWSIQPWEECRALAILEAALEKGLDEDFHFEPGSGDLHGIVCDTVDPSDCERDLSQTTMFTYRTENDETVWGGDSTLLFTDSRWAMYIEGTVPE